MVEPSLDAIANVLDVRAVIAALIASWPVFAPSLFTSQEIVPGVIMPGRNDLVVELIFVDSTAETLKPSYDKEVTSPITTELYVSDVVPEFATITAICFFL
jgi:hypothetical protein